MRPELQAKLIQHLNKKKGEQGFTLVELLVVIIIIGILTAIALPSFLNQSAKAKQTEGKTTMGSLIQSQQAYRTENPVFTTSFDELALGIVKGTAGAISSTVSYEYQMASAALANGVDLTAKSFDPTLKAYSGRLESFTIPGAVNGVLQIAWQGQICESISPMTSATTSAALGIVAPAAGVAGGGGVVQKPACDTATSKSIQGN